MHLKLYILSLSLILLFVKQSHAQSFGYGMDFEREGVSNEVSIAFGMLVSHCDLAGNKRSRSSNFNFGNINTAKPAIAIGYTHSFNAIFGIRADVMFGRLEAYDSLLKDASQSDAIGRYERNLNFGTDIFEIDIVGEFHPIPLLNGGHQPKFSPYIFGGAGLLKFKPQALVGTEWIDLPELRLEGQGFAEYPDRKPYKTLVAIAPTGVGVRYDISQKIVLRVESSRRYLFMDYLDDVHEAEWVDPTLFAKYLDPDKAQLAAMLYNRSPNINPPRNTRPRGNPNNNDAFWSLMIKFAFKIDGGGGIDNGFRKGKGIKCPYW